MKEKDYLENFELWAEECVHITDKLTGREVPFRLNAPQRRVLSILEEQRRAGKPIRIIMLKARQWGGSTLVQIYMAWMQLVQRRGWNSVTCAHVKDASAAIRGMYSRLLRAYPKHLKEGCRPKDWELAPFEKSPTVSYVAARDAQVALATAQAPNSVRGYNFAMAHLSEVAFWGDGMADKAEEIVRTICGSIARMADSIIVMESTANGTDNYFYDEWQRAVRGESDKTPIFVAWHEIPIYSRSVSDKERADLLRSFDAYENDLLARGIGIEHVAWYHDKRREYPSHAAMMAEYPSTAEEAFRTSRSGLLHAESLPQQPQPPEKDAQPALAVVVAPTLNRQGILTLFQLEEGHLAAIKDVELHGSAEQIIRAVEKWIDEPDCPLLIVDMADGETASLASRLAEVAAEHDLPLLFSDEDSSTFALTSETIGTLTAGFQDLCSAGGFREYSGQALDELRSLTSATFQRRPRAASRIAAAALMNDLIAQPIDVGELLF